ncbi:MAG: hypothetical protein ABW221_12565 [Vicinamibacteria bacterium]
MALVSVAGASSRAGKTSLLVSVLAALPRGAAAAVKFTTAEDVFQRCPRGTPCVVCDIDVPFRIVEDPRVLDEPGTDTARLSAAGARRVVWAIARAGWVGPAWRRAQALAGPGLVVMEGSTIVEAAQPDLLLFVAHPFLSPERWKPTTAALAARADAVVLNRPRGETRAPAAEVRAALAAARGRDDLRVADVTAPLGEWAPDLFARLGALVPVEAAR